MKRKALLFLPAAFNLRPAALVPELDRFVDFPRQSLDRHRENLY